jgi:hypothetical protein
MAWILRLFSDTRGKLVVDEPGSGTIEPLFLRTLPHDCVCNL